MKGTQHSEEQIIAILKQGEAGVSTAELCRQQNITEQTYCRRKAKCGGWTAGEAKRLKQLEDENLQAETRGAVDPLSEAPELIELVSQCLPSRALSPVHSSTRTGRPSIARFSSASSP